MLKAAPLLVLFQDVAEKLDSIVPSPEFPNSQEKLDQAKNTVGVLIRYLEAEVDSED